ncbi:MAG: FAD-binding protein [Verrucomicrobia bacterium]|nr:FAD-binding protein [Verrucomicrobiota bacterium]
MIQPANLNELTVALADANACGAKVASVDLRALNRLLAHVPEDMTVTVEAGLTLGALQTAGRAVTATARRAIISSDSKQCSRTAA